MVAISRCTCTPHSSGQKLSPGGAIHPKNGSPTYWAWNPHSGDTGGVLTDDWTTIHEDKLTLLTKSITNVKPERPITLTARAKGRKVTVNPPSWAVSVAEGGTNSHFGFCIAGKGKPKKITAFVP